MGCLWLVLSGKVRAGELKTLLMIEQEDPARPAYSAFMSVFRQVLTARMNRPITLYSEHLDFSRFDSPNYREQTLSWYQTKYAGHRVDAILAAGKLSFEIAQKLRSAQWPDAPIIFVGLTSSEAGVSPPAKTTGVTFEFPFQQVLDLIGEVCPEVEQVVFVSSKRLSYPGVEDAGGVPKLVSQKGWQWRSIVGLPMAETKAQLAQLPPRSVIFYEALWVDGKGVEYVPRDALTEMRRAASAPIFGMSETYVGYGMAGGCCLNFGKLGGEVAEKIAQVFHRTGDELPPVTASRALDVIFDWGEMKRWGLDMGRLPAGSEVRGRPLSLWETHRKEALIGGSALLLQSGLIGALLWQTARRRSAEKGARSSAEHASLAAESAELGLWTWEQGDDRFWATARCKDFYGFEGGREINGRELLKRVHPEDREQTIQTWRQLFDGDLTCEDEHRVVLPTGELRVIRIWGRRRLDLESGLLQITGVMMDVTDRRKAERDWQEHLAHLAHATRVATLGELSASLVHEMNQPLTAILNNAYSAKMLLSREPLDVPKIQESVDDILACDERASEVIRRIQDLMRKSPPALKPLSMASILDETLRMIRHDFTMRQVQVQVKPAPAVPRILGDHVQLQQVFLNLFLNAAEAMSDLPPQERLLFVETSLTTEEWVAVAVIDRGRGVPVDQVQRVFEPFHSTKPQGLGMGLSISRTIIQAHGGRIWIEANPSQGMTARFTLPVTRDL